MEMGHPVNIFKDMLDIYPPKFISSDCIHFSHCIQHCGIDKELNKPLGIQPVWALFTEVKTKVWVAAAVEVTVL